jgi:enamine deaminase RidA (YjgF/YER057c/UK114 family)
MEKLNPATLAQPVMNLYSQIVIAPAGARIAAISGQVSIDASGSFIGEGDYQAQARQCFVNISNALEAIGGVPENILQMRIHVVGHTPDVIPQVFGAGREVFGDDWPLCASTYIGVPALGLPDWLVEIDTLVALPG